MQRIFPLSPWQQARLTVRALRRFSVGQVLKSARTNTLPAGHRIGGSTCVMTGPIASNASIAIDGHRHARRDTLTLIPSLSARTQGRGQSPLRLYKSIGRVKVQ